MVVDEILLEHMGTISCVGETCVGEGQLIGLSATGKKTLQLRHQHKNSTSQYKHRTNISAMGCRHNYYG